MFSEAYKASCPFFPLMSKYDQHFVRLTSIGMKKFYIEQSAGKIILMLF